MHLLFLIFLFVELFSVGRTAEKNWIAEKHKGYTLFYTSIDKNNKKEYRRLVNNGISSVKMFFKTPYKSEFEIFIHPGRASLDSTWQKDWNMPGFRSECWMVASGVAAKLDMISPRMWDKEACEHKYAEIQKTQRLITHELVHVYHGQLNASPDFSNVEGVDWFVEGMATYASGQCDAVILSQIKKAIVENQIPLSLDSFWTGKLKYGLSGSVVMYLDSRYGRARLNELLQFNKRSEIFSMLGTTELELLKDWKNFISRIPTGAISLTFGKSQHV